MSVPMYRAAEHSREEVRRRRVEVVLRDRDPLRDRCGSRSTSSVAESTGATSSPFARTSRDRRSATFPRSPLSQPTGAPAPDRGAELPAHRRGRLDGALGASAGADGRGARPPRRAHHVRRRGARWGGPQAQGRRRQHVLVCSRARSRRPRRPPRRNDCSRRSSGTTRHRSRCGWASTPARRFQRGRDYYGQTVNRAARVPCAARNGGQVLLERGVGSAGRDAAPRRHRAAASSAASCSEAPTRSRRSTSSSTATGLGWRRDERATCLPRRRRSLSRWRRRSPACSSGADDLTETIHAAATAPLDGSVETVLLGGEPGAGKTSIASAIARVAHGHDWTVLFGSCDELVTTPYEPFRDAIGEYVELRADVGAGRAHRAARR